MLPDWDPNRLAAKIPFNLGLIGGRRQGKSVAQADLVRRMSSRFDLVVAFIGSAACSPVLAKLMEMHWDPRFFFSTWDDELISRLLAQQEHLKKNGVTRNVLLIVDDVVVTSKAEEQLANMGMRGRHFSISLAMCAVSYTSLPKRLRRSLDVLLVFSLPMTGDLKILTWEFCQQQEMAQFALRNLEEHQALVLETLNKRQELFVWRADHVTVESLERGQAPQTESPPPGSPKSEPDGDCDGADPEQSRPSETDEPAR